MSLISLHWEFIIQYIYQLPSLNLDALCTFPSFLLFLCCVGSAQFQWPLPPPDPPKFMGTSNFDPDLNFTSQTYLFYSLQTDVSIYILGTV